MSKYIDDIANKDNRSFSEILQDVLIKYPEKYALNLFLNELTNSVDVRYSEALLQLTDLDISHLKKYYESTLKPFPIIKLTKYEFTEVKYFIRNIDEVYFISNVKNIGSEKDIFIEVVNLNEMVLENYFTVDWDYGISMKAELDKISLLIDIKDAIKKYLEIEQFQPVETPQQTENPKPEQETTAFKNNFDNIKPIEIYNHFKNGLVDKGYLTEQELNEYLKAVKTYPFSDSSKLHNFSFFIGSRPNENSL